MSETRQDRRSARRVDANLRLQVALPEGGEAAALETINISSSGLYFRSDRYLEPMTKLALELEVRVPGEDGRALVPCEGLVVRTEPETGDADADDWEIAVFFTHVEPEGRRALEEHIAMLLDPTA